MQENLSIPPPTPSTIPELTEDQLQQIAISVEASKSISPETMWQNIEHPISVKPLKTPEIMTALRLRHKTQFGHLHVSIAIDVRMNREYEIFAQLGKAGELTASDLEGMCRLASLYLRSGGELSQVARQLCGIGSALSSSHEEKVSIANSLGEALARYSEFKQKFGLKALLLGEIELPDE